MSILFTKHTKLKNFEGQIEGNHLSVIALPKEMNQNLLLNSEQFMHVFVANFSSHGYSILVKIDEEKKQSFYNTHKNFYLLPSGLNANFIFCKEKNQWFIAT